MKTILRSVSVFFCLAVIFCIFSATAQAEPDTGPVITQQPENYFGAASTPVTLSVAAEGMGLKYQWQEDKGNGWTNSTRTGAKEASLKVYVPYRTSFSKGIRYRCMVTDIQNRIAVSNAATVIEDGVGLIISAPESYRGIIGKTAVFSVSVLNPDSNGTLEYQWRVNTGNGWKDYTGSGAKTPRIQVKLSSSNNGYQYCCQATEKVQQGENSYSTRNGQSAVATLSATVEPIITVQPCNFIGFEGDTASFSVQATANNGYDLNYRWFYYDWNNLNQKEWAGSGPSISFTVTADDVSRGRQRSYFCEIQSVYRETSTDPSIMIGTTTSLNARVYMPVSIIGQPGDFLASPNANALFEVTAETGIDGDQVFYQWQSCAPESENWVNCSGKSAQEASYLFPASPDMDGMRFRCVVTTASQYETISSPATLTITASGVPINIVNFPDEVLRREYMMKDFDTDGDGILNETEISTVTGAYLARKVTYSGYGIRSLKGLEFFTNLTEIDCSNNSLESFDLSWCTGLTSLKCDKNSLAVVDLSGYTGLTTFSCAGNQLTTLDVSMLSNLTALDCSGNRLTSLDVTQNASLESLNCANNRLSGIDVSQNAELRELICSINSITSLNITTNTLLEKLNCGWNDFSASGLDASNNTNLTWLNCASCYLSALDLSQNSALTFLRCNNNYLARVDVSASPILTDAANNGNIGTSSSVGSDADIYSDQEGTERLIVDRSLVIVAGDGVLLNETNFPDTNFRSYLEQFDTDGDGSLRRKEIESIINIYCSLRSIRSLAGINYFPHLEILDCFGNQIDDLDLSNNTKLRKLDCSSNRITTLDISPAPKLVHTALTGRDAGSDSSRTGYADYSEDAANPNTLWTDRGVTLIWDHSGYSVAVDATHFPDENFRTSISSFDRNLDWALDTAELSVISTLTYGSSYSIGSFEGIELLPALTDLTIQYQPVSALDLSSNTLLKSIVVTGNENLGGLNVRGVTALTYLNCSSNRLSALDVSTNTALTELYCMSNALTYLDVSSNGSLKTFYCTGNDLTTLIIGDHPQMTKFSCNSNNLSSLNLIGCPALTTVRCDDNRLSVLNIAGCTAMTNLWCFDNALESLEISDKPLLRDLRAYHNPLESLDIRNCPSLRSTFLTGSIQGIFKPDPDVREYDYFTYFGDSSDDRLSFNYGVRLYANNPLTGIELKQVIKRVNGDGSSSMVYESITGPIAVTQGDAVCFYAECTPSRAENKYLTWTADTDGIISLQPKAGSQTYAECDVTALAVGTVTVAVTADDGSCSASCILEISGGISLNQYSITLKEGNTEQLTAAVAGEGNNGVSWTSSDTAVASVDADGLVTALSMGNAAITATDPDGEQKAICRVKVIEGPEYSGSCGEGLSWEFYRTTGTLYILGSGNMESAPWANLNFRINAIEMDDGVTGICDGAFEASNISSVAIAAGVTTIGRGAFADCADLSEIHFRGDMPSIADDAFQNVTATVYFQLDNSTYSYVRMGNYGGTLSWNRPMYTVTYDSNGGTPVEAERNAYVGETIAVTKREPTRSGFFFMGWAESANATAAAYAPGAEISKEADTMLFAVWKAPDLVFPASVTSIEQSAFEGTAFTSAIIPATVTRIEEGSFANCVSLERIYIPNTVTEIEDGAFQNTQNVVIYCEPDSDAWEYADAKGIETATAPEIYNVTYDANGGVFPNGTTSRSEETETGEHRISDVTPFRKGYSFSGWTLNDDDQVTGDIINVEADVLLKGLWTENASEQEIPTEVIIAAESDNILVSDFDIDPRIVIYSTVNGVADSSKLTYFWEYAFDDGSDLIWMGIDDDGYNTVGDMLSIPVLSVGDFVFRLTVNGVESNHVSVHVENHGTDEDYIVIQSDQDHEIYYLPVTVYISIAEGGEGRSSYTWYKSSDQDNWMEVGDEDTFSEVLSEHGVWYYVLEVDGMLRSNTIIVTMN